MAPWKGKLDNVAITAAGVSDTVADITIVEGCQNLWVEVANSAHKALDKFYVWVKPHSDASFHLIANAASDYNTQMQLPIRGVDQQFMTLAKSTAGLMWMDVKGLYGVKFTASSTSGSDTTVNVRWSVR